ncbi:MAG: amino acid permease [Bacteroidota bacterium]|nr:amino acid permease [Bacteroidota bacterium]
MSPELQRKLNLQAVIAIVIGAVIGSGIFMKPAVMAGQLNSPELLLLVWFSAGVITLCGALTNAEVAAIYPETGGQYIFFKKMFGDGFAYLYGWASLAVFNTAGTASIAFVCAQYLSSFFSFPELSPGWIQTFYFNIPGIGSFYFLENIFVKLIALSLLFSLTWLNVRSVQQSITAQKLFTVLKILAILILIAGIFFSGKGNLSHFNNSATAPSFDLVTFMAAMVGAFWAYDGWNNITFVGGEIKNPQKNIPLGLLYGILLCMIIYVLMNAALIYIMNIHEMANATFIASDAGNIIWGSAGAILVTILVVIATLGSTNANVLATARVTHAFGHDYSLFHFASAIHPGNLTPYKALWTNFVWSAVLVLSGSFDLLTDMVIFVSWFFYGMSALGVIILRVKFPDIHRPYKVIGYPLLPILFILFTTCFLVSNLIFDIQNYLVGKTTVINSLLGIVITLIGLPFYFLSKKTKEKRNL